MYNTCTHLEFLHERIRVCFNCINYLPRITSLILLKNLNKHFTELNHIKNKRSLYWLSLVLKTGNMWIRQLCVPYNLQTCAAHTTWHVDLVCSMHLFHLSIHHVPVKLKFITSSCFLFGWFAEHGCQWQTCDSTSVDDFSFSFVNFSYLCSNSINIFIYKSPSWFDALEHVLHMINF